MPQLNPGPWFAILFLVWLVFTFIVLPKMLGNVFPNEPSPEEIEAMEMMVWTWTWH